MSTHPIRILSVALATVVLATSCGGGEGTSEVMLEARWQCDVQRQAFDDLAAIDRELDSRLATAGLTRADYQDFKEELSSSPALRTRVAEEYDAYCQS